MEVVVSMAGKARGLAFRSSSFPGTHASSSRLSVIYFLGILRAILGTSLRACSSTVSDFKAGASPWWGKQTAKKQHQDSRNGGVQDSAAVRHALLIDGTLPRNICPICAVSRVNCWRGYSIRSDVSCYVRDDETSMPGIFGSCLGSRA